MRHKSLYRVGIASALVLAVATSLWFASPVKSVDVTLPDLPTTMYTGHLYSFYAQVDINTNESIPIINLKLDIAGPTPAWVEFNANGTITNQSGHFVSVIPVGSSYYGYGYRYGSGYGYQPPGGYRYFEHWWGYGYGYGYGYGVAGTTQLKYLIVLNTTGMTLGSYTAQLGVNTGPGPKRFLSPEYSFAITTPPPPPIDGWGPPIPGPGEVTAPCFCVLTDYLDAEGRTTVTITLNCVPNVTIIIPYGTKMLDAEGNPLGSIAIILLSTPPPPPGHTLVGPAYDLRPDGATFEPPLTLTFNYDPADIPDGVREGSLVLAYWDGEKWVKLPTSVVDTAANTVSAEVTQLTPFAILAKLLPAPAVFTVSDLSISPAEVDIGQEVTISVLVTNTGDLAGSYKVTLKLDQLVVDTKEIVLAGGASQKVTLTTARDVAATYTVDVNGLTGTFVVKAAPPVVPPPVVPPPKPINWWLIGGIIAAVVVLGVAISLVLVRRRA